MAHPPSHPGQLGLDLMNPDTVLTSTASPLPVPIGPKWAAPTIRPTGPCPAKIMIVGDFPGQSDEQKGLPLVGYSGDELASMLSEAGIMRSACFVTLAVKQRPPGNDIGSFIAERRADITPLHHSLRDKFVLPPVVESREALIREIELCRPNIIIALGNAALWQLTGRWGVDKWRSSLLECDLPTGLDYRPKVIPTFGPSRIMVQWSLRQIMIHDLRRAEAQSKFREVTPADSKFVIRPAYTVALAYLQKLFEVAEQGPMRLAVDIETRAGHIACIGIAWSKREALCIPLMCVERPEGFWTPEQEAMLMWNLQRLLCHPNALVIGQNFLYDAQYFHRWLCYSPPRVRDTMIAQHVCFSNMQKSLDFLSSMYCERHVYWKDDGKTWDPKVPEEQLWTYNCEDAVRTFEIDSVEQTNVDNMGLREVHDFQQALFPVVLNTMNLGIRVDLAKRGAFAFRLSDEIAAREQWLNEAVGRPINIKSPKQMQEFFYEELNFRPIISRKSKTVTCDEEALRKLSEREPLIRPVVRKILELRSLGVFLSTFVSAALDTDGRLRCSFNIAGTETYRFSSSQNAFGSGLNFQNIPKGGEEGDGLELPNVRDLYIPDPGYEFFDIDLGSADLRIVTWESDEPELKAMLREGLDPYTEIAKEFYHDPSITKKDPRRQTFKSFAHGTNYLGTPKGLAERLGLSVRDAERTQAWYFGRFPKIQKWQNDLKDQVLKRRMVQNVFGYRTYFFDRIEGTVFNQAAAWIPQSTVGCLINRAYVKIHHNLPEVQVLLQVHDSLAGQYPISMREKLLPAILSAAEIELPYAGDPLVIPVGAKTSTVSWGQCG